MHVVPLPFVNLLLIALTCEPYKCTVIAIMDDRRQLTSRQREILAYIQAEADAGRYQPTIRELCAHLKMSSPGTAHDHLSALEKAGWIERGHGRARSLRMLRRLGGVPLAGEVVAGVPVQADEQQAAFVLLSEVFGGGELFVVRVRGDSMKDCDIHDGDHAVVRKQDEVESGEIALAVLNDEQTVKRVIKTSEGIFLQPANPDFLPIKVHEEAGGFRVAGKVIGILRKVRSH